MAHQLLDSRGMIQRSEKRLLGGTRATAYPACLSTCGLRETAIVESQLLPRASSYVQPFRSSEICDTDKGLLPRQNLFEMMCV